MNKPTIVLLFGLAILLTQLSVLPVLAQGLADTFSGFSASSDKPINIEADSLEVNDSQNIATFSGNVRVVQGDVTLRTSKLRVQYAGGATNAGQQIRQMDATGNVVVNSAGNSLSGDWAKFEMANQLITIGGNVVVSQGKNVIRGSKLVVNLANNTTRLEAANQGGRVQGSFVPKRSN